MRIFGQSWGGFVLSFKKRWSSVRICSVFIFWRGFWYWIILFSLCLERIVLLPRKFAFFCCSFIAEISFYVYIHFQCSSKFSSGTSCPLNVFILLCIAIFLMHMTVEPRPNKGASVVRIGICNICNSCLYSPPFKMQKYYPTRCGGGFCFPESRLWYKGYT